MRHLAAYFHDTLLPIARGIDRKDKEMLLVSKHEPRSRSHSAFHPSKEQKSDHPTEGEAFMHFTG
jgi:hypothetical protein